MAHLAPATSPARPAVPERPRLLRGCSIARVMAPEAGAFFTRSHIDPRHFVQLGTTFRIDGLQGNGQVRRYFHGEGTVRCNRERYPTRPFRGRHARYENGTNGSSRLERTDDANGSNSLPIGLVLTSEPDILAEQKTGRARLCRAVQCPSCPRVSGGACGYRERRENGPNRWATGRRKRPGYRAGSITAITSDFTCKDADRSTVTSSLPSGNGAKSPSPSGNR